MSMGWARRSISSAVATAALVAALSGCDAAGLLGVANPQPVQLEGTWTLANDDSSMTLGCGQFRDNTLVRYLTSCDPDRSAVLIESQPAVIKGSLVILRWSVQSDTSIMNIRFEGYASSFDPAIEGLLSIGFDGRDAALTIAARWFPKPAE